MNGGMGVKNCLTWWRLDTTRVVKQQSKPDPGGSPFDGWQTTTGGERLVKQALRKIFLNTDFIRMKGCLRRRMGIFGSIIDEMIEQVSNFNYKKDL